MNEGESAAGFSALAAEGPSFTIKQTGGGGRENSPGPTCDPTPSNWDICSGLDKRGCSFSFSDHREAVSFEGCIGVAIQSNEFW